MKRGKLIVFEGANGSGKTTQVKLILKKLKKEGYNICHMKYPQYNKFYGNLTHRYLKGEFGKLEEVSPYLASLLYACDRWSKRDELRRWLKEGKIVISDRYVSTSQIFLSGIFKQKKKQDEMIKWIGNLEYKVNKMPNPNFTVYLDVPLKLSLKLIKKRNNGKDIQEKDITYLKRTENISKKLIKSNKWITIPCTKNGKLLSINEIKNKVWGVIKNKI